MSGTIRDLHTPKNDFCLPENYYNLHDDICHKIFINFMEMRNPLKFQKCYNTLKNSSGNPCMHVLEFSENKNTH